MLPITKPTGVARWIQRWYPSSVLRHDPLQDLNIANRYVPIPIAGWKLTPKIAAALLQMRSAKSLSFSIGLRLTVIVPIRDREAHLAVLLPRLTAMLNAQDISFRILVVEQMPGKLWNKGAMINAGLRYAAENSDYFCLHDVDAIPVEANYLCPSQPLRLVTRLVGSKNGLMREPRYFGGVITLRREQVYNANGFSNQYWGWGKEDDDFLFRLWFAGYTCYSDNAGVFEDLHNPGHQQVNLSSMCKPKTLKRNRHRRSLLTRGLIDPAEDGVNSLNVRIRNHEQGRDYERIVVEP